MLPQGAGGSHLPLLRAAWPESLALPRVTDAPPPGYLERLRRLCAIDSPDRPPRGARRVRDADRASGPPRPAAPSTSLPSPVGLHVVARTHGAGGRRILLLGHHDTVFPPGTAAARPVRIEGERALGPGVADMKGGVLVGLAALERLARSGPTRPSSCTACPTRRAATSRRSRSRRCTAPTPRSASSAGASRARS